MLTPPGASSTVSPPQPGPAPLPGPHPTPTTTTPWSPTASGCGNFTIFAANTAGQRYLLINATKSELGIANLGDSVTVDLAANSPSVSIAVETFPRVPTEAPYCTDVIVDPQTPQRSIATLGTVTFTLAAVGREGDSYAVTVSLKNIVVRDSRGVLEGIPDLTYTSVNVGWLPG